MTSIRDWDAKRYDRISDHMEHLGREVLDRLELRGVETVVDAGCGSGRVTQVLVQRLPRGRVIGVDGSADMIKVARERLPQGTELHVQDLCELRLPDGTRADAVLSTATFHWIADHDRLFRALHAILVPGGRLAAQCGGVGNVAAVHAAAGTVGDRDPYAEHLGGWSGPWNFSTREDAERRLAAAGFAQIRTALVHRPVTPPDPVQYLETIVLGSHLERLPPSLRKAYVNDVAAALRTTEDGRITIDYVRLDIDAVAGPREEAA